MFLMETRANENSRDCPEDYEMENVGKGVLFMLEVFRSFVDAIKLMDLELKGKKFTWFSNPRNGFITRERLDRVLVKWEWREVFSNAILMAIPAVSSDHSLLVVNMEPKARGKREFKFETFWRDHEECSELIKRKLG
ncbi:hypothetical protein Ahy_A07g032492 [Arachis hypogaea]|uniref:Endonuclease/exonuclease/phosphatase domain-containing protein n=1 Tax=Arachis hypogaea TaxID=3818 RepID=A0A445C780_ARAHY|nr:hypothetical protein Ahy_A07g032492 [Arachis hypogaea]